jgi:hypothetical protein
LTNKVLPLQKRRAVRNTWFVLVKLAASCRKVVRVSVSQSNLVPAITILVVEDEYFVREDIVSYLRDAGCAVVEAKTGEHAIDICKSGASVDAVFTDLQLPGSASGFDVAETFRAAVADIPVVYASGNWAIVIGVWPAVCFSASPINRAKFWPRVCGSKMRRH